MKFSVLIAFVWLGLLPFVLAQAPPPVDFTCPMDPEVHAKAPGKCPRCGMKLVAGIPDQEEQRLDLRVDPPSIPAGRPIRLIFTPHAKHFEVVHEKLFHLFIVSHDLQYFAHDHPQLTASGTFELTTTLPKSGHYRLVADYYPTGGTPQLIPKTITTAGYSVPLSESIPKLDADFDPKVGKNLDVELATDPEEPLAGKKTMLFFRLTPSDIEPYIGAWGHLLAVSDDLVDTIHEHPAFPEASHEIQFNIFFPRPVTYRVWVQFQRKGVVNTVAFTVPVKAIGAAEPLK